MRIAITGTPGTGKTSATRQLSSEYQVVHLNDVIQEEGLITGQDADRETAVVDLQAVSAWLDTHSGDLLIESHLAHLLSVDHVIVLQCEPGELRERLEQRGAESASSITENVQAETMDVIRVEALERHGEAAVTTIDTTGISPATTADRIAGIVTALTGGGDDPDASNDES